MKKIALLLCFLLLLTGCKSGGEGPAPAPPAEETVLEPETLTVELSRNGLPPETLMQAASELPELLRTYFAEAEVPEGRVEPGAVEVTIGASPMDTAQALAEGTVDLAFLPAEAFLIGGGEAQVLLGDAPQLQFEGQRREVMDWNDRPTVWRDGAWQPGTFSLICTAPTAYGTQMASRTVGATEAELTPALTWRELDTACWGVLAPDSMGGSRAFSLWLADRYRGNDLTDLSEVTIYENYEELFRAAAAGEIDAFPIRADVRMDMAEAWQLPPTKTAESGLRGFDREEPIWEELRVIGETERLYSAVAAVPEDREALYGEGSPFPAVLEAVLTRLGEERPELMELLGCAHFTPTEDEALDPLRRLVTMEGGLH